MSVTSEIAALQKEMDELIKENDHILSELKMVIDSFNDEQTKREARHAEVIASATAKSEKNKTKIETLNLQILFAARLDEERGKEEAARKTADLEGRKAAFEKLRTTLEALGVEPDVLREYEIEAGYVEPIDDDEEGGEEGDTEMQTEAQAVA